MLLPTSDRQRNVQVSRNADRRSEAHTSLQNKQKRTVAITASLEEEPSKNLYIPSLYRLARGPLAEGRLQLAFHFCFQLLDRPVWITTLSQLLALFLSFPIICHQPCHKHYERAD